MKYLIIFYTAIFIVIATGDKFEEELHIKPLNDGKLLAHFIFKTVHNEDLKNLRWKNQFDIFPLSLTDIITGTDLDNFHFSLTRGNWNYEKWGNPIFNTYKFQLPSPPGAQIEVQFSKYNENEEKSWNQLTNSLAGLFCSSLSTDNRLNRVKIKNNINYLNLPGETFCSENLTPWKKLLPCHSGLASLLNAPNLLKSSYSSLSIHFGSKEKLIQEATFVFNPILYDNSWSLKKVFGNSIDKTCPIADYTRVHVDITDLDDEKKLFPQTYTTYNHNNRIYALFENETNIGIKQNKIPAKQTKLNSIQFDTHIGSAGDVDGTIVASIKNDYDEPIKASYRHILPDSLFVYMHSLNIKTKSGHNLGNNFVTSENIRKSRLVELSITLPPKTTTYISYYFERKFLRWSNFEPNVLIGSAQLELFDLNESFFVKYIKIYAKPLLLTLPSPDLSMPYNVICLVCTVLMLAFGPIHSLTTRKPLIKVDKKT